MLRCTVGDRMRFATQDFDLVLPAMELPFGTLVPQCKGILAILAAQRLDDGVLLWWLLEATAVVAVLEGCDAKLIRLDGQIDGQIE
jgi:hypothetical protein